MKILKNDSKMHLEIDLAAIFEININDARSVCFTFIIGQHVCNM